LHEVAKGSSVTITKIPEGKRKSQLIRLGIIPGEVVRCLERLPGGTIVLEKNRREVAIGKQLASVIFVTMPQNGHGKR
jgi:Fe2+ transport system protein FeoA